MKRIALCALLLFLATATYAAPENELTLGVLAFRPKPETQTKWQPLADYLTQRLHGTKVHLKAMSYPELEEALDKKLLDFVLTNPGHYVQLRNNNNLSGALATLVESEGGIATDSFGGTIFSRQDREDISELSHLKGKTIAAVSTTSLGGYQVQALELLYAGVRPDQIKLVMTKTPHDLVVDAVLQEKADAGFVRSGVLEAMAREGKLDMSGLKVLARREIPIYPYAVSTKLYPEWPFIALPHVDDDIARQVAAALLGMEHNGTVARSCGIHGFTIPADYTSVENLLRELRLPPFEQSPQFTLQDIWLRHRFGLIVIVIASAVVAFLVIWLLIYNRRLFVARKTADESKDKIRESLSLLKATLQSTADGILVVAADGSITEFNEQFSNLWKMPQSVLDLHDDQKAIAFVLEQLKDPEQFLAKVRDLYATPEATSFDVLEFKDGRVFERYSQPQRIDGRPVGRVWSFRDISERVKTEQSMRISEEKFRIISLTAADAIVLIDERGGITYWNPSAERLFGYSADEAINRDLHMLVAPEQYREAFSRGFSHFVKTGEGPVVGRTIELSALKKDGMQFPIEISISAMNLGGRWHALGIIRDVTDRKKTEELLRMTKFAVDNSADGVYWVGDDARILSVNDSVCRGLGYTRDELLTMTVHDISPELPPAAWEKHWEDVRARKSFTLETSGRTKDGRVFPVEVMINYVRFEDKEYNCAFVRDITERRKAEEALRESEEFLNNIVENIPNMIFVKDATEFRFVRFNKAGEALLGYRREDLYGKNDFDFFPQEEAEFFTEKDREVLRTNKLVDIPEESIETLHNGRRFLHTTKIPITDAKGNPKFLLGISEDITERKLTEEALQLSERNYREIFNAVNESIFIHDANTGAVLDVNNAMQDLYGFSYEEALQMGPDDGSLGTSPYSAAEAAQWMAKAIAEGPQVFEWFARKKSGELFWVEVALRSANISGFRRILAVVRDITERKLASTLIEESEERYRQLVNQSPDAICVHQFGKFVFVNKAAVVLLGAESDRQLIGTLIIERVHPDYRDLVRERVRLISNDQRNADFIQEKLLRIDGSVVDVEICGVPITYQGYPAVQVVVHDITERKQAEEKIGQLAREMEMILETLTMGVSFLRDRRVQWANASHDRIFGYEHGESMGLETSVLYADEQEYRRVGTEGYGQLAKGEAYTTETEMKRRDGTRFWCSLTGRAVNPANLAEGSIWMLQDITERKRAEAALQEKTSQLEAMTQTLEQRVKDEVDLRLKNEQFLIQQAKLAAMGEMLGAIAHQWRQPLNALGLCVQNIRDAYLHHDLNRAYLDTTVHKSMDQIKYMSKTIDDFRNFFAPDKEKRLFDSMSAAGDVLSLFGAQLTANDISFRLTCHTHKKTFYAAEDIIVCPEKSILGYQNEFEHVILNLISNAKDAIIARRETDRNVLSAPGLITFDFYNRDNNVVIEVGDNGTGIPASIMPRIFEPYFTMKEQSKGTGIGLYMSKIIIEDHMKGSLTVENGPDGAIFTIVLRQTEKAAMS